MNMMAFKTTKYFLSWGAFVQTSTATLQLPFPPFGSTKIIIFVPNSCVMIKTLMETCSLELVCLASEGDDFRFIL